MFCPGCNAALVAGANFCAHCGTAAGGPVRSTSPGDNLRQASQNLSAAAAPLLNTVAARLQGYAERTQQHGDQRVERNGQPVAPIVTTLPTGDTADTIAATAEAPTKARITERVGRGMGDTAGYAVRGATGTALQPAKEAWGGRESLPMWQNVLGTISLAAHVMSLFGVVFVALIYVVLMVTGKHGPGQAFRRLVSAAAYLFIIESVVIVVGTVLYFAVILGLDSA